MSRRLWVIASAIVLVICVAPFAIAAGEGNPLKGGARNPSNNESQSYTRETEVIANNGTYGTRQSNKSDNGGGAIYGCRSGEGGTAKGNEPCLRGSNLAKGYAFEFESRGAQGGRFIVGNGGDNTKPFTTNATGVADGLNADRVDGLSASEIVAAAQLLMPFARVSDTGALQGSRGVASATRESTGTYTVVFSNDSGTCAYNATVVEDGTQQGFASVQPVNGNTVRVRVRQAAGDNALADRGFHLTANCTGVTPVR